MPEATFTQRLSDLARELRSQTDTVHTAESICRAAAEWIDGDVFTGISLVRRRHRIETIAATSPEARRGDDLQYELREGPCLDAAWEQRQVHAPDLAQDTRWPRWSNRVFQDLGVRSMLCTQLFTNEDTLGALNIYSRHRSAFSEADRDETLALAAHAAVAVAAALQIEGLASAVDRRTTIGKALGIVMERFNLPDEQAFALLQRLSSASNRKLFDIATEVVNTRRLPRA